MWHWIGCKKKSGLGANPKMHLYTHSLSFLHHEAGFVWEFFNRKEKHYRMMHDPARGIEVSFEYFRPALNEEEFFSDIKFNTRNLLLFLSSLTFLLQKTVSSFSCDVSCRCLMMTLIINGSLIHWLLTRVITRVIVLMKGEILTCYKCTIACLFFQVFPSLCFSLFVFCFFLHFDSGALWWHWWSMDCWFTDFPG